MPKSGAANDTPSRISRHKSPVVPSSSGRKVPNAAKIDRIAIRGSGIETSKTGVGPATKSSIELPAKVSNKGHTSYNSYIDS